MSSAILSHANVLRPPCRHSASNRRFLASLVGLTTRPAPSPAPNSLHRTARQRAGVVARSAPLRLTPAKGVSSTQVRTAPPVRSCISFVEHTCDVREVLLAHTDLLRLNSGFRAGRGHRPVVQTAERSRSEGAERARQHPRHRAAEVYQRSTAHCQASLRSAHPGRAHARARQMGELLSIYPAQSGRRKKVRRTSLTSTQRDRPCVIAIARAAESPARMRSYPSAPEEWARRHGPARSRAAGRRKLSVWCAMIACVRRCSTGRRGATWRRRPRVGYRSAERRPGSVFHRLTGIVHKADVRREDQLRRFVHRRQPLECAAIPRPGRVVHSVLHSCLP